MAIRYANFDLTTGLNDGTSEANAWQTWADADAGFAAGDYLYVRRTASRHNVGGANSQLSFAGFTGTGSELGVIEGYGTTPGDGVPFQTSNRLLLQFSSIAFRNFDVLVDDDTNSAVAFQQSGSLYDSIVVQQGRGGIIGSGFTSGISGYNVLDNCVFRRTLAGGPGSSLQSGVAGGVINGCLIEDDRGGNGTNSIVRLGGRADIGNVLSNCVIRGPNPASTSTGVFVDQSTDSVHQVINCSLYRFRYAFEMDGSLSSDYVCVIQNNLADSITSFFHDNGGPEDRVMIMDNQYSNMSGAFYSGGTATQNRIRNTSQSAVFVSPGSDYTPTDAVIAAARTYQSGTVNVPGAIRASGGGGGTTIPGSAFGLLPVMRASEIG